MLDNLSHNKQKYPDQNTWFYGDFRMVFNDIKSRQHRYILCTIVYTEKKIKNNTSYACIFLI